MKRLIARTLLTLALVAGTVVVVTVHPQQAVAGCTGGSGCADSWYRP